MSLIPETGQLTKLTFTAFQTISFAENEVISSYSVMFNPSSVTMKLQIQRNESQPAGSTSSELNFEKLKPQDYIFEFIIDGTGATDNGIKDVPEEIEKLLKVVYSYNSDQHHPNFVKIRYGAVLLKCVLKTIDVTYNLFSSNAKPLRAKINCTFTSCVEQNLSEMMNNKTSPDITHLRTLNDGDSLVAMAFNIYKTNNHYLDVARSNNLNNFRKISTGTQLFFPPVKR